jgi:hypothetical protein
VLGAHTLLITTIQNSKKQVFMIKLIFHNILYGWPIGLYLHMDDMMALKIKIWK